MARDDDIARLPQVYQRLLSWADDGWSDDRIADELGIDVRAVGPLASLAVAKLDRLQACAVGSSPPSPSGAGPTESEGPTERDDQLLLELNRTTFLAESRPPEGVDGRAWDEYLADVLSDDFQARRANPAAPHQDREEFLAFAREASTAPRVIVGEPSTWVGEAVGAVACDVRLGDDDTVRFRNLKVFVKTTRWRCAYWQVTRFEPGAASA